MLEFLHFFLPFYFPTTSTVFFHSLILTHNFIMSLLFFVIILVTWSLVLILKSYNWTMFSIFSGFFYEVWFKFLNFFSFIFFNYFFTFLKFFYVFFFFVIFYFNKFLLVLSSYLNFFNDDNLLKFLLNGKFSKIDLKSLFFFLGILV